MNKKILSAGFLLVFLTACSSSDSSSRADGNPCEGSCYAAVATYSPLRTSSAHALLWFDGDELYSANDIVPADHSDTTINSYQGQVYRIERSSGANVMRFLKDGSEDVVDWQYSVRNDAETPIQANPQTIVFASDHKAYVLKLGSTKAWIVNPSAQNESEFKLGELDLSAYADQDGAPEMAAAIVVDGKLFIAMQRLNRNNGWSPENTNYIAVFDTATDTEIDTMTDMVEHLKGIPLSLRNVGAIVRGDAAGSELFVQAVGDYGSRSRPAALTGGVEAIDFTSYATRVVIDDDAVAGVDHGRTASIAIASQTLGYISGYISYTDNVLYAFNPTTGEILGLVNSKFEHIQIGGLAIDPKGRLWVSDYLNASVYVVDTSNGDILDSVSTNLNPGKFVFLQE